MNEAIQKGTISFINHEKQYAMIDYLHNGRKKTINCKTDRKEQAKPDKHSKKTHHFRIGDEVNFQIKLADRGDKMIADNVKFLYNTAIEQLINKAAIENRFSGYLKIVDDSYFVKEWDSYLFFPLLVSKWEKPPAKKAFNEAISFRLINLDKPNNIAAELFSHDFIPEYHSALQQMKNKTPVEAIVYKVSPYAAFLNLFNNKIQARIQLAEDEMPKLKAGDKIKVLITYLISTRIVVERI
jgi:predicted RNA-binding protein (virulence factor B family)